jgi:nucleoside-diphosphate-sugar epimerase
LNNKIGIIGCGWLGLPLAKSFIEDGFKVKGTTTSEEKMSLLKKERIEAFKINISENTIDGNLKSFFIDVESLIINIPPKLRGAAKENYVSKMELLHDAIKESNIRNIIFVSSTAVYGEIDGIATENTLPKPTTESGIQLLESENIFKNDIALQTTIIRFGGLISSDRHPVTMLSKREGLENGNMSVNLIHRNDCIRIIMAVVKNEWWGQIINGVHPDHPSKREYYTHIADERGIKAPNYKLDTSNKGKVISSEYLINVKKFHFLTPIKN